MSHHAPSYPMVHQPHVHPPVRPPRLVTKEGFMGLTSMMILTLGLPAIFLSLLLLLVGASHEQEGALVMLLISGFGSLVGMGMMRASSNLSYKKKMLETQAAHAPPLALSLDPPIPASPSYHAPTLDEIARQNHGLLTPSILSTHGNMPLQAAQAHLDALVRDGQARCDINAYGVFVYTLRGPQPKVSSEAGAKPRRSTPTHDRVKAPDGTDGSVF